MAQSTPRKNRMIRRQAILNENNTATQSDTEAFTENTSPQYDMRSVRRQQRFSRLQARMTTESEESSGQEEKVVGPKKKKMTGIIFLLMVLLALGDDILLDGGFNSTGVFAMIPMFASWITEGIIFMYLVLNGVKPSSKKVIVGAIGVIIEMIPFLNYLPMTVVTLFAIRFLENHENIAKLL